MQTRMGRYERAKAVRENCKGKIRAKATDGGIVKYRFRFLVRLKAIEYKEELFYYLSSYTCHQAFPICAAQDLIPYALSH